VSMPRRRRRRRRSPRRTRHPHPGARAWPACRTGKERVMKSGFRQFLFFVVLLAVPLASFFLVFRPQNREIARARLEIDHKQAMLEKLRQATGQSADLARANQEIRQSIDAIQARLPTTK